jgi:hypothetical protein
MGESPINDSLWAKVLTVAAVRVLTDKYLRRFWEHPGGVLFASKFCIKVKPFESLVCTPDPAFPTPECLRTRLRFPANEDTFSSWHDPAQVAQAPSPRSTDCQSFPDAAMMHCRDLRGSRSQENHHASLSATSFNLPTLPKATCGGLYPGLNVLGLLGV